MKNLLLLVSAMFIFFGCTAKEVVQPVLVEPSEPIYPYEAKVNGIEGKVEMFLNVNEQGTVDKVTMFHPSGSAILDDAAIEYVQRLKFKPAMLDDKPVAVVIKWGLNYKIADINIENGRVKILAFSKTNGIRHESIDAGRQALSKLALSNNFDIEFSEDSTIFNDNYLSNFNVIVFLNTSGDIFGEKEEKAFINFIKNNGGFVGIHNATDTERDWAWYKNFTGTQLKNYPDIQTAVVRVTDIQHPSTKGLPYKWERKDEWVNFTNPLSDDIKVLAVVDESSYKGGENGLIHPFCWYNESEGGRAWYTMGGHTPESFSDPVFMKHILGGIKYAAGVE